MVEEFDVRVGLEEALRGTMRTLTLRRPVACATCGGDGVYRKKRCEACGGQGVREETSRFEVRIPAGVRDGQRLRVPGRGGMGRAVHLRVRFEHHPNFAVQGDDLVSDAEVAPWVVVLGGEVEVPTLEGSVVVRVPAGSRSGTTLRVRGRGLAVGGDRRGDLMVRLRLQVPATPTEEERPHWEALGRLGRRRAG